jgi:hypothetical protein
MSERDRDMWRGREREIYEREGERGIEV